MWYEIFKFELKYRAKRPETYVFFFFLFLFSMVGVDFIFQGVEMGLMKKNAPLVIGKTMAAITGIFMIMASMIMGVPVLRDFQYNVESLLFINPIKKRDYLLGRFLGSFVVLLFIFGAVLFGMMVGEFMPWHQDLLPFTPINYMQSFTVVVLPILFFGASLFFVTGMLSKKLLVVYTQGIFLFVVFLLTKAIKNEYLQALLDPFSLTTLTKVSEDWSVTERNSLEILFNGVMLHNKLFWLLLGVIILMIGYHKFSFTIISKTSKNKKIKKSNIDERSSSIIEYSIPRPNVKYTIKTYCLQLVALSKFYVLSLLKETSFWAIVICGMIIILINSVNLGTVYGVDSYPTTYFIVEELQEMSLYFFIIILLFYSGELIWKERNAKLSLIYDATPISDTIPLISKFVALVSIYIILMLSLIVTGILFQIANGYYNFELKVYFFGFFLEILPFLMLYTIIALLFQVISNNKFVGILLALLFFIVNVSSEYFGFQHSLYKFGGKTLGTYSSMNGYGHFLKPYLWIKIYWLLFASLLLIISAILSVRGTETKLIKRFKGVKHRFSKRIIQFVISISFVFIGIGSYIFYNTNILNDYWTSSEKTVFRANYEKLLKQYEYIPQPKITKVHLNVELFPENRSYSVNGYYILKNTLNQPIHDVHIQKKIASHVQLDSVIFVGDNVSIDTKYSEFDYLIYSLSETLHPGDSIKMKFIQSYTPKGFEDDKSSTQIVNNGTFFNNKEFPTIGYNKKYELSDKDEREEYKLAPRLNKAKREDQRELVNAISGGDSDGINFEAIIGTNNKQTAITSGVLVKQWEENNRNYFHYKMNQPMINFYSIVSADYETRKDTWQSPFNISNKPVSLEIYHHNTHEYNLDRMMASMKASLNYFSTNFSPYQYTQLRIMEFPRYEVFAQSFPNTIPFSEAIGFVLDIDDQKDVDMAFYVTAHEVAHQWFGMQVEAANVRGRHMILETLSQYAALMVLKDNYPEEKIQQFLEFQREMYHKERKKSTVKEPSLELVENQDYIYYNKGAVAMFRLQKEIGEDMVNKALQHFIRDWHSQTGKFKTVSGRYATSKDLLSYFREVTPGSLQYIITDLFEKVE
ncbi:Peptidase family M1 [Aquimarina amphilecti]|uniref:Peptidase family M1 n=1 Tax=Aquimarina amphilecti TaxID=1038014 RepID=A0A1H7HKT4_AQUAM|nr:M1 family aminopeptidase [Aquimarina amphilecti]SEK49580.1 Peptidase family M1 [Aquimarina amphilecti]